MFQIERIALEAEGVLFIDEFFDNALLFPPEKCNDDNIVPWAAPLFI